MKVRLKEELSLRERHWRRYISAERLRVGLKCQTAWVCHLLAVWCRASCLTSLSLGFIIFKMGIVVFALQDF